jgi:hypothetical protein
MVPVVPIVALSLAVVLPGVAIRRAWRRRHPALPPLELQPFPEQAALEGEPAAAAPRWLDGLAPGDRAEAGKIAAELNLEPVSGWHMDADRTMAVLAQARQFRKEKDGFRLYFGESSDSAAAEVAATLGDVVPLFTASGDGWQFRGLFRFQKPAAKSVRCELAG